MPTNKQQEQDESDLWIKIEEHEQTLASWIDFHERVCLALKECSERLSALEIGRRPIAPKKTIPAEAVIELMEREGLSWEDAEKLLKEE